MVLEVLQGSIVAMVIIVKLVVMVLEVSARYIYVVILVVMDSLLHISKGYSEKTSSSILPILI